MNSVNDEELNKLVEELEGNSTLPWYQGDLATLMRKAADAIELLREKYYGSGAEHE